MKRSRFSEEQIIVVLGEAESGTPVKDLCLRAGIGAATFYKWKTKYDGTQRNTSDASAGGRERAAEKDRCPTTGAQKTP
jgi:hypothetical protein